MRQPTGSLRIHIPRGIPHRIIRHPLGLRHPRGIHRPIHHHTRHFLTHPR